MLTHSLITRETPYWSRAKIFGRKTMDCWILFVGSEIWVYYTVRVTQTENRRNSRYSPSIWNEFHTSYKIINKTEMEASDSSDTVQTARMIVTIVQLTSGNVHSLRYELSCKQRCRFLKADFPPDSSYWLVTFWTYSRTHTYFVGELVWKTFQQPRIREHLPADTGTAVISPNVMKMS